MDMMHIYMCIHMYIHVCECVCVCLCMCMCPCMKALISRTGAAGRSDGAGIGRWSPVELGRQRAQQVFYRPGRRHSASGTVCVCVCVCLYTRLFVYIHTHTHTHTYKHTHTHTHIYIHTHTYIYVYIGGDAVLGRTGGAAIGCRQALKSPHILGLFCPYSKSLLTLVWSAQAPSRTSV